MGSWQGRRPCAPGRHLSNEIGPCQEREDDRCLVEKGSDEHQTDDGAKRSLLLLTHRLSSDDPADLPYVAKTREWVVYPSLRKFVSRQSDR